jgi:hypothetical protein
MREDELSRTMVRQADVVVQQLTIEWIAELINGC